MTGSDYLAQLPVPRGHATQDIMATLDAAPCLSRDSQEIVARNAADNSYSGRIVESGQHVTGILRAGRTGSTQIPMVSSFGRFLLGLWNFF